MNGDDASDGDERYYTALAAAFVRGAHPELASGNGDDHETIANARAAEVRIHRFKRAGVLPRVERVLGLLRGFYPETLLDVGSGRGAFLWPLLEAMPDLAVTALDVLPHRIADLEAVAKGGITRLTPQLRDVGTLDATEAFDVATILEVLEHLSQPERAAAALLRAARRVVIATVPSKADDNPEHIHLFDKPRLQTMFTNAGARRVDVEFLLNHIVVVAHK